MSVEKNWSFSQFGASIAEVSHEASHAASGASNLLMYDEQQFWIAGDPPQYVTLRITSNRPAVLYAGWHVWHDYLTNPRVVEISSGASLDTLETIAVCKALPGSGSQVWRLPRPIPPAHIYIRFTILETFGSGPSYMNNVILLSSTPDSRYNTYNPQNVGCSTAGAGGGLQGNSDSSKPNASSTPAPQQPFSASSSFAGEGVPSSSRNMRQLLKELNEDIRLLKPIKSISPKKNLIFSMAPPDTTGLLPPPPPPECSEEEEEEEEPPMFQSLQTRRTPAHEVDSTTSPLQTRVWELEKTVAALAATVQHQREDIALLKRYLFQEGIHLKKKKAPEEAEEEASSASTLSKMQDQLMQVRRQIADLQAAAQKSKRHQHRSKSESPRQRGGAQLTVDFPEAALRAYVHSVVDSALDKQLKKMEKKMVHRLDRYLVDMIGSVTDVVEERVETRMQGDPSRIVSDAPMLSREAAPSTSSFYHFHHLAAPASPAPAPAAVTSSSTPVAVTPTAAPAAYVMQAPPPQPQPQHPSGIGVTPPPFYASMAWVSPALSIVRENTSSGEGLSASRQM